MIGGGGKWGWGREVGEGSGGNGGGKWGEWGREVGIGYPLSAPSLLWGNGLRSHFLYLPGTLIIV